MIEQGRRCSDELQQINAVTAALRQLAAIIAAQHVEAGIAYAIESEDRATAVTDLVEVLDAAIKRNR